MGAIRFLLPALLAINGLVNAQAFGDLSSCGQNCINNMREGTPCVPVTDQCLCENTDFQAGIRDCATQACAAADADAAISYANSFCISATGVSSTAAATSEAATTTAPTTTAAAETTTTPASSAETTSSPASSIAAETSTSATSTETTSFSTSTTASSSSSTSSSETDSETKTSTKTSASSSASASSTAGAVAAPPSNGLSVAGKAGVAVGVGAAGVALLALALAMCRSRRARRSLPRGTMQISEPLPGSGRIDYDGTSAQNPNHPQEMTTPGSKLSTAFNMAELDHARPYEEMVPRVTPRRMV
ncbi:hypothetical protein VMCG_09664 [Cytospora schulzeri]|uniref:CFEM domain-containing protein n=1 Tax=Cytospora schulzeri TaxID=448051 RepID=A0A423VK45_9PEZI|nr:hypothetical protein VMCG_09664 [Valsa malicola]